MIQDQNDPSPEQIDEFARIVHDPVKFAQQVLGVELWRAEVDFIRSIEVNRRTAMKACHGVGKTFSLGVAALWWLARWDDGIVLTTAPTFRQVTTQLWTEIHRLAARSRIPYPEFNQTGLKLRSNDNFAMGLSTNRPDNFSGYHGRHVLILADEAPGIESGIWEAIAGVMSGGVVHIVMAGNPTVPSGAFFDAFNSERALWNCITMDVFDTSNLEGLMIGDLLQMDPRPYGPLDDKVNSYLPTRRWVRDQYIAWWHGDEDSSPSWMSRVRGQFPAQSLNALIKMRWLERSQKRSVEDEGKRLIAGVDVGGGSAETVVYLCEVIGSKKKILKFDSWRKEDTLDDVARFLDPYQKRLSGVRVDGIGIGHVFGIELRKKGFPVELVNVGLPCENKPEMTENNPAERFTNLKAQYYQNLADSFQADEIDGLADDATIGQLAGILAEIDSKGRTKIEPKEKAAARGVPSPDRAEALMLALGEAPHVYEFIKVPKNGASPVPPPSEAGGMGKQQRIDAMDDARASRPFRMGHGLNKGGAW